MRIKDSNNSAYFPEMEEVIRECIKIIGTGFERSPIFAGSSAPLPPLGTNEIMDNMIRSGTVINNPSKRLAPESVQSPVTSKRVRREESEGAILNDVKIELKPLIKTDDEVKPRLPALEGQEQIAPPPVFTVPSSRGHLPQAAIIISDSRDVSPTSIPELSGIAALQGSRASERTDRIEEQYQGVMQELPAYTPRDKARAIVDMVPTNLFLGLMDWSVQNHEPLAAILNGRKIRISGDVEMPDALLDKET